VGFPQSHRSIRSISSLHFGLFCCFSSRKKVSHPTPGTLSSSSSHLGRFCVCFVPLSRPGPRIFWTGELPSCFFFPFCLSAHVPLAATARCAGFEFSPSPPFAVASHSPVRKNLALLHSSFFHSLLCLLSFICVCIWLGILKEGFLALLPFLSIAIFVALSQERWLPLLPLELVASSLTSFVCTLHLCLYFLALLPFLFIAIFVALSQERWLPLPAVSCFGPLTSFFCALQLCVCVMPKCKKSSLASADPSHPHAGNMDLKVGG